MTPPPPSLPHQGGGVAPLLGQHPVQATRSVSRGHDPVHPPDGTSPLTGEVGRGCESHDAGRGATCGSAAAVPGSARVTHPHPQSLPTRGREARAVGVGVLGQSTEVVLSVLALRRVPTSDPALPSPGWGGKPGRWVGGGRGLTGTCRGAGVVEAIAVRAGTMLPGVARGATRRARCRWRAHGNRRLSHHTTHKGLYVDLSLLLPYQFQQQVRVVSSAGPARASGAGGARPPIGSDRIGSGGRPGAAT